MHYDCSFHRWLVNQGRDDEALAVLSKARGISADADLVRLEFLCVWGFYLSRDPTWWYFSREIRTQHLFEKEVSEQKFPDYQDGSWSSSFKLGFYGYVSLIRERRKCWYFQLPSKPYMAFQISCIELLLDLCKLWFYGVRKKIWTYIIIEPCFSSNGVSTPESTAIAAYSLMSAGVNAILYYAPIIFQSLGLTGNTVSLLATGVVGIV